VKYPGRTQLNPNQPKPNQTKPNQTKHKPRFGDDQTSRAVVHPPPPERGPSTYSGGLDRNRERGLKPRRGGVVGLYFLQQEIKGIEAIEGIVGVAEATPDIPPLVEGAIKLGSSFLRPIEDQEIMGSFMSMLLFSE